MRKLCFALLLLLPLCFEGCISPKEVVKYVEVPYEVTRTEYVSKIEYDSIYIKEREYIKGDTIYLTKYEYKYKLKCDTIRDSIPCPYPVYVDREVEKAVPYTPKAYKALALIGVIALLLAIIKLILKIKGI